MAANFSNVPVGLDTVIMGQAPIRLAGREALYQRGACDGHTARSIIFRNADVATMADEELAACVQQSSGVGAGTEVTVVRAASGYAFVNFDCEIGAGQL